MSQSPDIQALRQATPGTAHRMHLNNAGAALPTAPMLEAMRAYLDLEATIGGYEAAEAQREVWQGFYPAVARLIGAQPHQVAFTGSATDSFNRALTAIPFRAGDVVLTTTNDYVSNQIAFLQLANRQGVRVVRAANEATGELSLDDVARALRRHRPRLVAVTHVPTNSGLVQPVADIGRLCAPYADTLYMVDACQSAGQMPLDVADIGCDFLSATFRKFLRGPRGAGFLYISDRVLAQGLSPFFLDLHSATWPAPDEFVPVPDAKRFETWERAHTLMIGARMAAEYATALGLPWIEGRVTHLADLARTLLAQIPGMAVLDRGTVRCGIVTCALEGYTATQLKALLAAQGINTSVATQGSARIDMAEKGVGEALRISPHYYNTEEEVTAAVACLSEATQKL